MKKVLAIIALSLALVVAFVSALNLLDQYNAEYSNKIHESGYQKIDVETIVNEKCYLEYDVNKRIEIEPGESIHVYGLWYSGKVYGEYVSEEGKSYHITHSDITAQKTSSEELKQLVISMNGNIEKLDDERAVIRVVIPGVFILLFAGVVWASWKLLRRHHVSK